MEHSDKKTFADCFHTQKTIYQRLIAFAVMWDWMMAHDFGTPTEAEIHSMDVEMTRRVCEAWGEIYTLAVLEWQDSQ